MTYFRDLSPYEYGVHWGGVPGAQNVGWLALGHPYETAQPLECDLDLLWSHCQIAIHQTRGMHFCEFCRTRKLKDLCVSRNGEYITLGTSEIRVIGKSGQSYAAPNLIYHYVSKHHYKPPDSFLFALRSGPKPPSDEYFDGLQMWQLAWRSIVRSRP
jgi:hypothetical protein